ncbi:CBS domain-containing protein [Rhodoplanes sp. TEM]|uniref:CBS domain-containing protein n=1 Tax=Rhodoplanes tepidamans TaxID=200616 RepID=A0ABT5JE37_RHOTP|nr:MULTISPECIES: CBS domain-containing protein [Rhodoplanes]MDC7787944.1 CBS domain-containing protein [Rhodoplanes tepidamans]MDC7986918.1 CBS domain-containing protein [Rhodoplanes sp. TEM]MDQ0358373.1 CBS domain-containing protein [Rhodoplanes tepidamans]
MKASDIMATSVVTVTPDTSVQDVAEILLKNRISGVPVVDPDNRPIGIVSEGDLFRRAESGTGHERSWWLKLLMGRETLAAEFVKEHARRVADVMTRELITATPDTPVAEIASLLERHHIKRVPIVQGGRLVGLVSRANLLHALATLRRQAPTSPVADADLRKTIMARLEDEPWLSTSLINVTVTNGVVDAWGVVDSAAEKQALRVAIEEIPGVRTVNDNLVIRPVVAGV